MFSQQKKSCSSLTTRSSVYFSQQPNLLVRISTEVKKTSEGLNAETQELNSKALYSQSTDTKGTF